MERLVLLIAQVLREAPRDTKAPRVENTTEVAPLTTSAGEPTARPPTQQAKESEQRRERRLARYEEVCALYQQGWTLRAIGKKTGLDRRTVRKFVTSNVFPEMAARPKRESKVTPFAEYLKRRWEKGCHNGALLRQEPRAMGYTGGQSTINYFLNSREWRAEASGNKGSDRANRLPSPRRIAWLLTNGDHPKVEEKERDLVQRLGEICPEIQAASELGSAFCTLVRKRQADGFDEWLQAVAQNAPPELRRFAAELVADKPAVLAGLSLEWSNGQTEGQVNRLKFIKPQMYGRANFDPLRARVLPKPVP
jgi:transposase